MEVSTMHLRSCIGCAVLLAAALFTPASPVKAQEVPQEKVNKLVSFMQQDGFPYKTTSSPTVFVVHFTGTNLKDIKVIIALGGDVDSDLVVFVTVTPKATMPPTADFRAMLLRFNHEFDQVKVGFDADDDLSVRIDASMRVADATYVKNVINQVKSASDEIYGKIQSQLNP
jgi:hypothetical protein